MYTRLSVIVVDCQFPNEKKKIQTQAIDAIDAVSLTRAPNATLSFLINDFGLNLGGHVRRAAMPKAMPGLVLSWPPLIRGQF